MYKGLVVLVLGLVLTGSASAALVGYWPLDGDGEDASSYGNHGAIHGNVTPTTDRFGAPDSAMLFGGASGDYVDVGNGPEFQITGAMTLTAWVYLDSSSSVHGARNARIIAKMAGGGSRSWSSGIEKNIDGVPYPGTVQVSSNGSDVIGLHDNTSLPLDQWVHYAGVYRPGTSLEVYLDGELSDIRTDGIPASQYSSNGYSVLIGNRHAAGDCGWYGALDEVRIYDEALSQTEVKAVMGAFTASNPDPENNALHVDPAGVLSWDGPASATSPLYDVYLGTDPNLAGETRVSAGQAGISYAPASDLQLATKYYWRVDVNEAGRMYEGPVWSFTTQGLASDPFPHNGATSVDNNDITLTWAGESAVVSYDVYWGTSQSVIASAARLAGDIDGDGPAYYLDLKVLGGQWLNIQGGVYPSADLNSDEDIDFSDYAIFGNDWLRPPDPAFKGSQTSTVFDPGTLDVNKTYYWRVDEVFPAGTPVGDLWSFTTWAGPGSKDLGQKDGVMWEYLEWSLGNPSWSGNPFDLVATVTFTHAGSGSTHTTEMFYDGESVWRFRFTGTRTGKWTFVTASSDPELDGLTGSVTIQANPNPDVRGFLTNHGNKYAIQTADGNQLRAYRLNVYMNGQDFPAFTHNLTSTTTINAYIDDARQYEFDTIFVHVCNGWFDFGSIRWDDHDSEDPDPRTFEALENLIATARSRAMRVQIWAWGDEARRWTPIGVGGINGTADRRLQRYIAARLGPLPGWTMGYGFDLQEWVSESQVGSWALYLHQHLGWRHMLWARGRSHAELDAKSYSGKSDNGQPFSYNDAVSKLNSDLSRPHFYEERFTYLREGAWTMENTRRALWHYTLAGGIGSWWGFYKLGVAQSPLPPYPNPEQLATVNRFWDDRFLLDMQRANSLTDGYCLKTTTNSNYVFYRESTSSVQMDLSGMASARPAVAVDTRVEYAEIDLGTLSATSQSWTAPYVSDWAIAVGDFD